MTPREPGTIGSDGEEVASCASPSPARGAAVTVHEDAGYVPSGDGWVYSFLCRSDPPRAVPGAGVVLLAPLAEERKSSLRPMVEIARALARAGLVSLRIDFRGTGDSSGESSRMTLSSMVEDAATAARYLRESERCASVALLGLRLGASVAVLATEKAAREGPGVDALCLIEPVTSGGSYVRDLERLSSLRRMLTQKGESGGADRPAAKAPRESRSAQGNASVLVGPSSEVSVSSVARDFAADDPGAVDLDGLALGRGFLDEIARLDLAGKARELASKKAPPSLVIQVGPRKAPSAGNEGLARSLGEGARLTVLRQEPFWLQADYVGPGLVADAAVSFLESILILL